MADKRKTKRIDSNSVYTEAEMAQAKIPEPPAHIMLRESDLPFWRSVVRAREYNAWTEPDLENAANLARCKADIERIQREIDVEGDTIENKRGTPVVNPKHTLLETLMRRSVALSRLLHVHAEATEGESRHQRQRNTKQRETAQSIDQAAQEDDGLIAPPVQH